MAFNLGDKYEICNLRMDVLEVHNHLVELHQIISKYNFQFLPSFKSWKHPNLDALDTAIVTNIPTGPFDDENADEAKAAHVTMLDLTLDRLVAIVQFSGCLFENVLRHNRNLTDLNSAISKNTSTGLIAKRFGNLLQNAFRARQVRSEILNSKYADASENTNLQEIKLRNACPSCRKHEQRTKTLILALSEAFGHDVPVEVPNDGTFLTVTDVEKCFKILVTFCNNIEQKQIEAQQLISESENLRQDEIRRRQGLQQLLEKNSQRITEIAEQQQLLKQKEIQKDDLRRTLEKLETKLNQLSLRSEEIQLEEGALQNKLQSRITDIEILRTGIRNSEEELQEMDEDCELVRLKNEEQQLILTRQIDSAHEKLKTFDRFDKNWVLKQNVSLQEAVNMHAKWKELEETIKHNNEQLERKQQELQELKNENAVLTRRLNAKKQERLPTITETPLQNPKFLFDSKASRDLVTPNSFELTEDVPDKGHQVNAPAASCYHDFKTAVFDNDNKSTISSQEISPPSEQKSIRALFSDFMELPDIQNMPEWDLVASSEPDFGITVLRSELAEFLDIDRPRITSVIKSHTSGCNVSGKSASRCSRTRFAAPSQLPFATQKLNVNAVRDGRKPPNCTLKPQIMEASWVVSKPSAKSIVKSAKINKSKNRFDSLSVQK